MPPTGRSGVTLTEILFAILVMGVGLLSVLSLFPIGLLNVARAVQLSRAGAYADAVLDDLQVRRLLAEERYRFGPVAGTFNNPSPRLNNPFIADHGLLVDSQNADDFSDIVNQQGFALSGERGLPVAIDPLWLRALATPVLPVPPPVFPRHRLGVLSDGAGNVLIGAGGNPANWGVQRAMPTDGMNNDGVAERLVDASDVDADGVADAYPDSFTLAATLNPPPTTEPFLPGSLALQIFGSRDDIVFRETDPNSNEEKQWLPLYSPQFPAGEPLRENKYTSLVTAYLPDAGDPTRYEASVAVFFNREFPPPAGVIGNIVPPGERTLLAYYLPQPGTGPNSADNVALPIQPSNQMILMWPANEPAPEVPREGWFLDGTYDANANRWSTGALPPGPGRQFWPHRAFWYRIVGRGEPQTGYFDSTGTFIAFEIAGLPAVRQLITLDRPVRETTWAASPNGINSVWYPLNPNDANFNPIQARVEDDGNNRNEIDPTNPVQSFSVNVAVLFTGLVGVYERTITVPNP